MTEEMIRDLSPGSWRIRWAPWEQLHFTLKFLGESAANTPGILAPVLHEVAAQIAAFDITMGPGGVFPRRGEPRVLWLGVNQGKREMGMLVEAIETACLIKGFPRETRAFHPHLTVGRVKTGPVKFNCNRLEEGISGQMGVESFVLVESVLGPGGPVYREVDRFKLGSKA